MLKQVVYEVLKDADVPVVACIVQDGPEVAFFADLLGSRVTGLRQQALKLVDAPLR